MKEMSRQDARLNVVRCLMNYMVVLLHASAAFQYVQHTGFEFRTWTFVCSHLCWMSIPTFFLISGYLLFRGFSFGAWPEKMLRRVKRLAVPYVAWNILFVVFYLLAARAVPRLATRVDAFGLRTFEGALGKIAGFITPPIDGPLWFLRALFFFALISPILWWLVRRIGAWIVLAISLGWVAMESFLGLTGKLGLVMPAYSIACMLLGCALAVSRRDLFGFFSGAKWIGLAFIACALRALFFMIEGSTSLGGFGWLRLAVSYLPVVEAPGLVALCSFLPFERLSISPVYRRFQAMGFFVYAGHFLFCSIWLHLAGSHLKNWMDWKLTVLVAIFVIGGFLSMAVVHFLLERLLPNVLRIVEGRL